MKGKNKHLQEFFIHKNKHNIFSIANNARPQKLLFSS